ncbi:putative beta-glucosidase M [Ilyonectria destructans]|nr:putative beta-glucosidase M [Ilyonectria destructans]
MINIKNSIILGLAFGVGQDVLAANVITEDSVFYGQSPAVYPSPEGAGSGSWSKAYKKAKAFVGKLTHEEKVSLTSGAKEDVVDNGCAGNIGPIERVRFPGMCLADASQGVRGADYVNGWSTGLHVGASWNKELTRERAVGLGTEFLIKGANMMLGPVVGPLGRVLKGGRVWETFSTDPYMAGVLAYETVTGVQSVGVGTSTKHFVGNEQEKYRMPSTDDDGQYIQAVSSNIDDKTLHEFYVWPFMDALNAGTTSIMCSYQRLNNSYSCQNSKLLNGILKEELGFQGYVVSDWTAQHAGIASANAGLDIAMPDTGFWGKNLTHGINNGTMESSRLDDMVTRLMTTWYYLDQEELFHEPGAGLPSSLTEPHKRISALSNKFKDTLFQSAIEGHVLVKNDNALPLKSPKYLGVFGYDAKMPASMSEASTIYMDTPAFVNFTMWCGGGSGQNSPPYIDAPINAIQRRAREDNTQISWDFESQDPTVDATVDACLVFLNAFAIEGADRNVLSDTYSDMLVKNVASKCSKTIVVIHNSGVRLVNEWIDHGNVTALIYAHMPGQDTGGALVDLLYGNSNSWGRLPYTVAKQDSDYGELLDPALGVGEYALFPQSDFTEGVYTDYRQFDEQDIEPQFEFGFGLTYTEFKYSGLSAKKSSSKSLPKYPPKAKIVQGGNPRIWDEVATVSATVQNVGSVNGDEVAQLYIGIPGGPIRQLRGFEKVTIKPGSKMTVKFSLTRRDLSIWDTEAQDWKLQRGTYKVYVGKSSRDLPLAGKLTI